jgi:hypothetical protein
LHDFVFLVSIFRKSKFAKSHRLSETFLAYLRECAAFAIPSCENAMFAILFFSRANGGKVEGLESS